MKNIPAIGYAFLLGFLCHMAGDTTVHPYVNSFAGVSGEFSIGIAATAFFMGRQTARTHRLIELNFDVYLAAKYYGAPRLSDNPGNKFWSSWSDFIAGTTSMEADRVVPLSWLLQSMIAVGNQTYPSGQKKGKPTVVDGRDAVKTMVTKALDFGYDASLLYVPDKATWEFVQHKWRDRNFESYLEVAAQMTVAFWRAAAKYYAACLKSPGAPPQDARKEFLKVVRNFSLDTGYVLRVFSEADDIHIRYDHCWALFLRETGAQAVDMETDDMRGKGTLRHSPNAVL
jgi:hypothetical protein